jgi:hypothetical protein
MITPTNPPTTAPDPTNAAEWLAAKIALYQAEVERLEGQLKHAQILLKGHQIWLDEVKRKEAAHDHQ